MITQTLILSIILLLSAIPLAIILSKLTDFEKKIYNNIQYFPTLLWTIAIAVAIFYTLNLQIAISLTFIFLLILVWSKL